MKGDKKMSEAVIVLAILYLCGKPCGKGLAICAIILGVLCIIREVCLRLKKRRDE